MNKPRLLRRLGRYGAVGIVAAAVHAGILLLLSQWISLSLANPIAFLAASLAGYVGHALVTFREETGGKHFARRWLVLQYAVNLSVCALLPLILGAWVHSILRNVVLVFTPTVLNALIWSRAAQFSARQRTQGGTPPLLHADDLGLGAGVDHAIFDLVQSGRLDGASLLVNGPTAKTAINTWRQLPNPPALYLHLCLTEGPGDSANVDLPASFGRLLLASWLPWQRRRLKPQIRRSLRQQISRYKQLTGANEIHLDGHQHVHLIPIVLDTVLGLAQSEQVTWIRTTAEPLPTNLPLHLWWDCFRQGGALKWLVLQCLTKLAKPKLRAANVGTNGSFAGVLFTGRMTGKALECCWYTNHRQQTSETRSRAMLLIHPAQPGGGDVMQEHQFTESFGFFSSPQRQREWQAIKNLNLGGTTSRHA
ncbi:ChbG/HpnK family deacetylase [Synechococcus sp. AH-601-O20]|nr:ChbG/HpnK family deacetylase [Synechococcus sp. AH-601-O20]